MTQKALIETDQYMTKKQKILYEDLAKAMLKYFKDSSGTVYIDDVKIEYDTLINEWKKLSFFFKVEA